MGARQNRLLSLRFCLYKFVKLTKITYSDRNQSHGFLLGVGQGAESDCKGH